MRVILFANGEIVDLQGAKALIQHNDILIAADGGARFCKAMDLVPNVLIGDLDSLSIEEVDEFREGGTQILSFDPRKDETDLELALLHALSMGAEEVMILGGLGRRWDHTLANLLLPAHPSLKGLNVSFWEQGQWFYFLRDIIKINAPVGTTLSLIPLGGDVEGVNSAGLEWSLKNETLKFGVSRGMSNLFASEQVSIEIKKGVLLVIVGSHD